MRLEEQWKYSDLLRRKFFIKFEIKKLVLKSLFLNQYLKTVLRIFALYKLNLLGSTGSKIFAKNRCIISGRSYNILKKFNYSRFAFRAEVSKAAMLGWRRYSW